MTWPCKPSA